MRLEAVVVGLKEKNVTPNVEIAIDLPTSINMRGMGRIHVPYNLELLQYGN